MRSRYRRQPGAGGVLVRGQVRGVGVEQRLVHRDAVRGQRGGRRQLPGGLQRQRGGVQVRHGDDDERFLIHAEDQTVRKTGQQATTHARLDLRAGQWESRGASHCPVDFIEKLAPHPYCLFIVPDDRVIEFLPCHGKKTDSHARRCLAMTVS